jgi:phage gpG-like protein
MEFSGTINTDKLSARFKKLGDSFEPVMVEMVNELVEAHRGSMTRRASNRALKRRTGALARSARTELATTARPEARSMIGRGAPYAKIHETGGTITPRRRQFLTVPLRNALTAAGVTRQAAKLERGSSGFRTRGTVPGAASRDTFIFSAVGGRRLIAVERKGGGVLPLYILRKRVTIPARLGFRDEWRQLAKNPRKYANRALKRWLAGAGVRS